MTQIISKTLAAQMVREYSGSQFFSVVFVKRTDKTIREMVCRKGVSKFTNGRSLSYNPAAKNLITVWEANSENPEKAYRSIPLDSILEIKMCGNSFKVA